MAAAIPNVPVFVPPGGAPAVATAPHLPFGGDPGTITGWLLDATSTETSSDISRGLECWRISVRGGTRNYVLHAINLEGEQDME